MSITYTQNDLVNQVYGRVDDQPDPTNVVQWLNAGMNVMAMKVSAVFPPLSTSDSNSKFIFDDKWAEIPVLYACARFKQSDLMFTDADRYMQQFNELLREFAAKYQVPPQYKDDPNMAQFIATASQTDFIVTDETFDPEFSPLTVYQNNKKLIRDTDFTLDTDTSTIVLTTACVGGEFVSIRWELSTDTQSPPYTWWTNW